VAKRVCPNGHVVKDRKATHCPQCGAELPPLPKKKRWPILVAILAVLLLCVIVALTTDNDDKKPESSHVVEATTITEATERPAETKAAKLTSTPKPTKTPKPTRTAVPPTVTPTSVPPTAVPKPVILQGAGQTATDWIDLPSSVSVAHFTHSGSANFIVYVYRGDKKDLLINTIGAYDGTRPLFGIEPVMLDIQADGTWTLRIEPITMGDTPAFSGKGDAVSPIFDPPKTGPWSIQHNGQENFIVYLHCASGSTLIQNEIGSVDGSRVVSFGKGPCLWEVRADGGWSLEPK